MNLGSKNKLGDNAVDTCLQCGRCGGCGAAARHDACSDGRASHACGRSQFRCSAVHGSYFCSQYFLRQPERLWREAYVICRSERIPATLVVPVFSQKDLVAGKKRIARVLRTYGCVIDEIVANDVGMLEFCRTQFGLPVSAGRLLSKMPRDPRFANLFDVSYPVGVPTLITELFTRGEVRGIELDPTHAALNLAELRGLAPHLHVGVHVPYGFLSTGNLCEFASVRRPRCRKFRANAPCSLECARGMVCYQLPKGVQLVKAGRTVLFPNHECLISEGEDFRMIVSPLDVLMGSSLVRTSERLAAAREHGEVAR